MPKNNNIILLKIKAEGKRFIVVWMGGKVERLGVKIIRYCGYMSVQVLFGTYPIHTVLNDKYAYDRESDIRQKH